MHWTEILIPPDLCTGKLSPREAYEAIAPDGRTVQCAMYGDGSRAAPYRALVRVRRWTEWEDPDCENSGEPLRMPTLEEVQDAINHHTPNGCLLAITPVTSTPPAEIEWPAGAEWAGVMLSQVGALEGSEAHRGSLILEGGNNAN